MNDIRLEKLRRFALVAGILLITYVVAGITVEPRITAFGMSFRVSRPNWLPVGLALASLYGAAAYYYYGIMLGTSPHRKRRDLLDGLTVHFDEYDEYVRPGGPAKSIPMYCGPQKFSTSPLHYDRELMERRAATFDNAFPKWGRKQASARVVTETSIGDDGEEHRSYCVEVDVPRRCRTAAILEDLDYTAPVWLNVLALLSFVWSLTKELIPLGT